MRREAEITENDIVYISGPMTGIKNANRETFAEVAAEIQKKYGCRVLNPADGMPDGLAYTQYMAHALQLLSCATAICMLPGYKKSCGAMVELVCAKRDGLTVCFAEKNEKQPAEKVKKQKTPRAKK